MHPIRDGVDGFVRGLFTFYPENTRQSLNYVIDAYTISNIYAGVRSQDGVTARYAFGSR